MSGSIYQNIEVKLTLDDTWAAARYGWYGR
jgi:hypothetical protein